jgi:hypothetical protein
MKLSTVIFYIFIPLSIIMIALYINPQQSELLLSLKNRLYNSTGIEAFNTHNATTAVEHGSNQVARLGFTYVRDLVFSYFQTTLLKVIVGSFAFITLFSFLIPYGFIRSMLLSITSVTLIIAFLGFLALYFGIV